MTEGRTTLERDDILSALHLFSPTLCQSLRTCQNFLSAEIQTDLQSEQLSQGCCFFYVVDAKSALTASSTVQHLPQHSSLHYAKYNFSEHLKKLGSVISKLLLQSPLAFG